MYLRTRVHVELSKLSHRVTRRSLGLKPYFTIYHDSSPNTDIIPFLTIIYYFSHGHRRKVGRELQTALDRRIMDNGIMNDP